MRNGFVVLSRSLQDSYANSGLSYEAYSFYLSLLPLANHVTYRVTLSQTDIASELQIYKSRVSRYLSELLLEGWVAYAPVQRSRRVKPIQLLLGWWDEEKKQIESEAYTGTPLSSLSPTTVLLEGSDLGHRQDTGETQVGHAIAEMPAAVDVERLTSLNHVNTETKNTDHVAAVARSFLRSTEGKEGNDKEGDEADVIDMGEEWRRKYASMKGDDEQLSLDEQMLLLSSSSYVNSLEWQDMSDNDKRSLIEYYKEDS